MIRNPKAPSSAPAAGRSYAWIGPLLMVVLTGTCAWFIATAPGQVADQPARILFVGSMLLVLVVYARDLVVCWQRHSRERGVDHGDSSPTATP
ncbi:hypothetical protein [Tsukamurella ocularis]|uniref:hypothetical protein n=1 Tax=Tsukamurella ocularis TaxID=1970234 RepID=UPI0021675AD7|nr:hypothetical protein [Tsukamurella ocularis]MCS3853295.1 hypothetical protein [Tsukamurella ocularis]